jgi:two-component SAPR family response regulator
MPMPATTVVRCLGDFSLVINNRPVERWRAGKARSLFQYLLANRGRLVHRDRLYEVLWPEAPWSPGSSSLKVAVHGLRQIVAGVGCDDCPPVEIVRIDCGYRLRADGLWADFEQFERAFAAGRQAEVAGARSEALAGYQRAADAYRGDFLVGETADWVVEQREWLRAKALRAMNALLEEAQRAGDTADVIHWCQLMLQLDPYQEAIYRTLMLMHGRLGHLGQVRSWHEMCVRRLRVELAVEPDQATTQVFAQAMGQAARSGRSGGGMARGRGPARLAAPASA